MDPKGEWDRRNRIDSESFLRLRSVSATSVAATLMVYMPSGGIFGVTSVAIAPAVIVCFKIPDLTYRQQ